MSYELHPRSVTRAESQFVAGLAVVAGLALLAWRVLDQTGDSLAYAFAVRTGRELFHPHHLLYSAVTHVLHVVLARTGLSTDAILAMQWHNVAWATVALAGFYRLGREAGWTRPTAAIATALLFACNGFLEYATQAEVYVPAMACLIMLVLRMVMRTRTALTLAGAAELCGWWLLAIGYHQTNVLFALPLVVFAALRPDTFGLLRATGIVAVTGALCLAMYVLAFQVQPGPHDVAGFMRYCLSYAVSHVPSWGTQDNVSVLGLARLAKAQLAVIATLGAGRTGIVTGLALCAAIAILGLVVSAAQVARERAEWRPLLVLALVWLLSDYAFFLWWLPGEKEFYLATLVPLLLLIGTLLQVSASQHSHHARQAVLAGGALALLVHGVRSTLLPLHASRGTPYQRAADIAAAGGRGEDIATGNPELQALRYYFDIERGRELLLPLARTLATGSVPDSTLRPAGRGLLLDLNDLRPDRLTQPNGFDHRREWSAFVRWVFEASPADSSGAFEALAVERTSQLQRSSIVLLSGRRERYASWPAFFVRLDSLDTQGPGAGRRVFSAWSAAEPRP